MTFRCDVISLFLCVQESERKAYNPRPFCKTYTMDKQPLNTGEQKDMTEFFTDLITKIEEMSQDLVRLIKVGMKWKLRETFFPNCDIYPSETASQTRTKWQSLILFMWN